MAKRRNLNGLPNSLTQKYFSTVMYFDGGYMADWIWNSAENCGATEVKIDILNKRIEPADMEIRPLIYNLSRLEDTIRVTLIKNGFDHDFIKEAYFNIYIPQKLKHMRLVRCITTLKDQSGHEYKGKIYSEHAYENKPLLVKRPLIRQSIWVKVKRWFA
ncbi:MAG TPA: hypothetical protein PK325_09825 [Cyclobacteriaceae bacterium]|nr:hypothetical protein [Cyclobacteriaceae bacterium]HMV09525.1 hypothetical protein [Cyclobacteriaceae bacterium]HMX02012.1 hypothetical protein [Cyclobacteriaceae bacterium]HMX51881.1 hypothetical protein [Cyclobacteriaceae bacterium]HMY94835.1 hypothetical protein [Cyclobacteriaceae bacterium]